VSAPATRSVFVTGGTGYIGRRAIEALLARGHAVRALVRAGSEARLPSACGAVRGDALDAGTFADSVAPADTFVQLVGTPRPSPAKAAEFERVDWGSVRASVEACRASGVRHFVYLSVAQPSSLMRSYVDVRARGEALIRERLLDGSRGVRGATFLRPWYVLGPGHRWPYALVPMYWLMERIPSTRERAVRLGLVTLPQMIAAIVRAVEDEPEGARVIDVPAIRGAVM
jgi:nucleoside-diphosphate-sugar epimerase